MIFWWGHNVTKVTINRMLPNWPSRHTVGVFLMPVSLSRMSQRFLDPGSPNMHQNRQKKTKGLASLKGLANLRRYRHSIFLGVGGCETELLSR